MNPETNNPGKAHKIKIIMGVSLPVLVILVALAITFLPRLFFTPKYDFVYSLVDNQNRDYSYYYLNSGNMYKVEGGKVTKTTPVLRPEYVGKVKQPGFEDMLKFAPTQSLYRYKVATDSFEPITLEQAQKLTLTGNSSAPDGTVLDYPGYYNGGLVEDVFIGSSRGEEGMKLRLHNGMWSKKVTVTNTGGASPYRYYYGASDFNFLGWVVGE